MKKAFDQTVRDLKREVNKKVLKVPGIEQKILDATSNEPWGPHGSLLADIAHATRNYHEYQIIMHVMWKRLNDTGKNWRHVYKALTVLDYLVGHGSERVIDDIREHAYQISTLSDFQYIDSSGRDQGSNVRRKSQSLVSLVNDKERIQEVRQKAAANKDKYRSSIATGGRGSFSGSGGYGDRYDDDRSEGRYRDGYEGRYKDEDRNGSGRERDWGSRDDEKYGKGSDSYSSRDGDRYGRDSGERYGRDNYRDDDYKGGRGSDDSQFGPRNRSFDRDRDRFSEEDDRYSSRHNGGRGEEPSQDERRLERKLSEQSPPPSYEAAVKDDRAQDGKGVDNGAPPATNAFSPPAAKTSSPATASTSQYPNQSAAGVSVPAASKGRDEFDEFNPRGSVPAAPAPASGSGIDLFGNESAFAPVNSLALVPVSYTTTTETDAQANSGVGTNFVPLSSASTELSQPSEDLFGDGPFKAAGQQNFKAQPQNFTPAAPTSAPPKVETSPDFGFGNALGGLTYTPPVVNGYQQHFPQNPQPFTSEFPMENTNSGFVPSQAFPTNIQTSDVNLNYHQQPGPSAALAQQAAAQPQPVNYHQQPGPSAALAQPQPGPFAAQNLQAAPMDIVTQGLPFQAAPQTALSASGAQPPRDKFETKSTVWTDTLSRGLVNLNISGAKVNPLADIGVDFDAINRMDRRNVKSSAAAPATSSITMGKAMGSGSGTGRAGASSVAPLPNPMMGPTMGMGRGMGMGMAGNGMSMGMPGNGMGMGMAGNGMSMGMPGNGMGMGMGMPGNGMGMNQQPMGMGMGMGMNQGAPMRPPMQNPGYNPGMGMGGYGSQQPYGSGYR